MYVCYVRMYICVYVCITRSRFIFTGFSGQHIGAETSVNNYQSRQRNNPEGRRSPSHRSGNLKSQITMPTGVYVPIHSV